jgi:hypothetical protein
MDFQFTEQDLEALLDSPIHRFEKERKLCGKCDHYSSVSHAGLKCTECGGDMVSVKNWTVGNLLLRVKPIPTRGEQWLSKFVSDYLFATRQPIAWHDCNKWAVQHRITHLNFYRAYRAKKRA